MDKSLTAFRLQIDDIDYSLMSSISNWCIRLLVDYLMIIHQFVIDYTTRTIFSKLFFLTYFR